MEGLNPLMPFLTMVKTGMPHRQSAGLLASGTLSRAIFSNKHILNNAAGTLVFFDGTTNDDDVCFVWHRTASFQHAASLLACRYTRNLRYKVSEDEHLQLLNGEGILYYKVPKKCKKCNKTNDVSFKHSLNCGKPTENVTRRIPFLRIALKASKKEKEEQINKCHLEHKLEHPSHKIMSTLHFTNSPVQPSHTRLTQNVCTVDVM